MSWTEFLQKIVDSEDCGFGREPKARFLKIFADEDSKKYLIKQEKLAAEFFSEEHEQEQFGKYLDEIYKALKPLNRELLYQIKQLMHQIKPSK